MHDDRTVERALSVVLEGARVQNELAEAPILSAALEAIGWRCEVHQAIIGIVCW